jgi:hypothetical protein
MNEVAKDFLARCFAPSETIALLLRTQTPSSVKQPILRLHKALEPRYLAWLAHENSIGANVYVAANPLVPGSRKRTKESIGSIRHLYLDIDEAGDARLDAIRLSNAVPTPTAILSTSPGKYQILWRVSGFGFTRQEQYLKLLAMTFGGDPACTDRNRVLRLPGFLNRKYDPAHRVTVEYPSDSVWNPNDFRLEEELPGASQFAPSDAERKPARKHSASESDWAWASRELSLGKDALKLTRELASRRSDKSSPLYYAQRTVDVASARLWLLEGIRIDDVITMLEVRRRFEFPSHTCSARAREIAATAQRMIARGKTA